MSENEPEKPKRGWGCLQWSVVLVVLALIASNFVPTYGLTTVKALQMKGSSNARQIIGYLVFYASEHEGHYPDFGKDPSKLTSNEAFRDLIRAVVVDEFTLDETIFSCPRSAFIADKKLGEAPDFKLALTPGENHWMMMAGSDNTSASNSLLVMENAFEAVWPPKWLPYTETPSSSKSWFSDRRLPPPRERGRSWPSNTIILGRNDASVEVVKLEEKNGLLHLPSYLRFKDDPTSVIKILDVEVENPGTSSSP